MVTTQYFNRSMTSEAMKALYKKLVKQYHPDINHGISDEFIKAINNEFSYWYARAASSEVYEKKSGENPQKDYSKYTTQAYIDSLEQMIAWIYSNNIDRLPGLDVDLVGVFIWISGISYEMVEARNLVKGVGFQGAWKYHDDGSKEYMWKYTPEIKRFAANPNIDDIKRKYGSVSYKRSGNKQLAQ